MITLRRHEERRHVRRARKQDNWLTFYPQPQAEPLAAGFGALQNIGEDRLPVGASIALDPRLDVEIITYVLEGDVAYGDSKGQSGVLAAGEFQCITAGRGITHSHTNASRTEWAHLIHLWLRPSQAALEPSSVQKRFSAADRRGTLCVVASHDGRRGSLRIHQDTVVHSAMLDPGQHLVHELAHGRSAWLHVVRGDARLGDLVLTTGDGAGLTAERAVSLTACEQTEILVLDLAGPAPPARSKNKRER